MAIGRADLTWVKNFRLTPRNSPTCSHSRTRPRTASEILKRQRRLAGAVHVRNTLSLERFRLYGLYYTPPTLIAITVRRCISAIIASASEFAVLEGLHTRTQSFVVRVYELLRSRQLVILTAVVKLLIAADTRHSKRLTHMFSHIYWVDAH